MWADGVMQGDTGMDTDTYLQFVLQEVFLVGEFAVEAEKSLLVCREGLHVRSRVSLSFLLCGSAGRMTDANINFVLLVRIHACGRLLVYPT